MQGGRFAELLEYDQLIFDIGPNFEIDLQSEASSFGFSILRGFHWNPYDSLKLAAAFAFAFA